MMLMLKNKRKLRDAKHKKKINSNIWNKIMKNESTLMEILTLIILEF